MDYPKFIVLNQKEESIHVQRIMDWLTFGHPRAIVYGHR